MSDYNRQQNAPIRASRDDDGLGPPDGERRAVKPRGRRSSSGLFLTLVLVLVVLASLGLIWKQSQEIAELRGEFDELDNLIRSTDESLSESGTALQMKIREQQETLDKHWSEIKKLWGVSYDRNRKAIEENTAATAKAAETASQAKALATKQQGAISEAEKTFAALEKELNTVSSNLKNLSSSTIATSVQLEELESRLQGMAGLQQKLNALSTRLADAEQGLKAMDAYRSQVNQQLNQLRQRVDATP